MKIFFAILFVLFCFSCTGDVTSAKSLWKKHEGEFEAVANLLRSGKLRKVYGRSGFEIPDSFRIKAILGSIVFRETDFTYDSSYSILFRVGFDSSHLLRAYPTIAYTNNQKRLSEYSSKQSQVEKLEDNWYFLSLE